MTSSEFSFCRCCSRISTRASTSDGSAGLGFEFEQRQIQQSSLIFVFDGPREFNDAVVFFERFAAGHFEQVNNGFEQLIDRHQWLRL
jgi:hypothetical protein